MTLTLYRCPNTNDWLCPCGNAARALTKHGMEAEQVHVARKREERPEIEALSGQQRVPLLVLDDGEAICDSRRIAEHLAWLNR